MMKLGAFALALILPLTSFAAVIFEPVQYQYRDPVHNRPSFYYGGSDPAMIVAGRLHQIRMDLGANPIRNIGFSETYVGSQASNLIHHGVSGDICVTYSDLLPAGVNAFMLGVTPDDAQQRCLCSDAAFFPCSRSHAKRDPDARRQHRRPSAGDAGDDPDDADA